MDLVAAGFSHKNASIRLLNAVSFSPKDLPEVYRKLLSLPTVKEALVLSTCNRSEIYAVVSDLHEGVRVLKTFFETHFGRNFSDLLDQPFRHFSNDRMVTHLFATIVGLESLVIGETQIAGQVRLAYQTATENRATGLVLNRLFHRAFEVNKRVRAETQIGVGVVSVGHAAVQLAEKIFYPLSKCKVLILGAGETARSTAKHFRERGVSELTVANRTFARAQAVADEIGGRPLPLDRFLQELPRADVVVSATHSPEFLLTAEMLRRVVKNRENRPLFFIDLSVPADFDPRIRRFENVYLYTIDDLRHIVEQNRRIREKEAALVRAIIAQEVQIFLKWLKGLEITPTLQQLRKRFETIRQEELQHFRRKFSDEDWSTVEELTRRMTNKMLHTPTVKLKELFDNPDGIHKISLIKQLFELDES